MSQTWLGYMMRHLESSHLPKRSVHAEKRQQELATLADLLSTIGEPDDPKAQVIYEQMRFLFLTPFRVGSNGKSFVTLPALAESLPMLQQPNALLKISTALLAWRSVTGQKTTGRCDVAQVVAIMLSVPDPMAYVQHLKSRGIEALAAMFHPNTFARAKRDTALRGVFAGSGAYWQATENQLNIVTD